MVTGFDYLSKDGALQQHWLRRIVAIIIDTVVIYAPISVLFKFAGMSWLFPWWFAGAILFLYASLFDYAIGGTVGKMLLHLKSVPISGKMTAPQALMRNITKIFPPILLLDWIIGLAMDTQDPRQKLTDRLANTSVMLY